MNRLRRWNYSLCMLVTYVTVFAVWKCIPSRTSFFAVGAAAVGGLLWGMLRAKRGGYFTNRVDLTLHSLVIADLCIESTIFEAFRRVEENAVITEFHDNMNFVGCALAFTFLLGGHRWLSLRGRKPDTGSSQEQLTDGATYSSA